jgi:hypothetical protein
MKVLPYTHDSFQRLPGLSDAGKNFDGLDGFKIVKESLMPSFREFRVEYTFGVTLCHRHFDLSEDERLVEYKDTSVPRPASSENLVPPCWLFDEGHIRPYEFKYGNNSGIEWVGGEVHAFLEAFYAQLISLGALGVFGLCTYPGNRFGGRVEMTMGRANINFDPAEVRRIQSLTGTHIHDDAGFRSQCSRGGVVFLA